MFKSNKAIKEYTNSIDKIKIPNLKGEEYICTEPKKKIKLSPIIKRSFIACTAICALIVFNIVSSSRFTNNDFSIKVYAGTNTIDIESGKIMELPSGWVDKDTFNMQGLLLQGDKIKKVALDVDNGTVNYIRTNSVHAGKQSLYLSPNGGFASNCSGDSGILTVKFISEEIMNKINEKHTGENIYDDPEIKAALDKNEEYSKEDKYPNEDKSFKSSQFAGYSEFENDEQLKNHYILWTPDIEFLKDISEGKEIDYLAQPGATIKFTVTFKDDTEVTKILHLSFNENGNLNCELD